MSFGRITKLKVHIAKCQTRISYANGASRMLTNNPSGFAFRSMGHTSCHCADDASTQARSFLRRHFGKRGSIERSAALDNFLLGLGVDFTAEEEAERQLLQQKLLEEQQERMREKAQQEQLEVTQEITQAALEEQELLLVGEAAEQHSDQELSSKSEQFLELQSQRTSDEILMLELEQKTNHKANCNSEKLLLLESEQKSENVLMLQAEQKSDILLLETEQKSELQAEQKLEQPLELQAEQKSEILMPSLQRESAHKLLMDSEQNLEQVLMQELEQKSELEQKAVQFVVLEQKSEHKSKQMSDEEAEQEAEQESEQEAEQAAEKKTQQEHTWYLEHLPKMLLKRATRTVWQKEQLQVSNCSWHLQHCNFINSELQTSNCQCQNIQKKMAQIKKLAKASMAAEQKSPWKTDVNANLLSLSGLLQQLGDLLEQQSEEQAGVSSSM